MVGTAAGTADNAIDLRDATIKSTISGGIEVLSNGAGLGSHLRMDGTTIGELASTGSVLVRTDSLGIVNATIIQGADDLIIRPTTPSASIGIGGGTGTLDISDAELDKISPNFASVTIGDTTAGTGLVDVDAYTFGSNVIVAGGSIDVDELSAAADDVTLIARTGSITDGSSPTDVTGGTVTIDGDATPGQSPGILSVNGDVELASGGTVTIEVGGTSPGTGNTDHDQIDATGSVTIDANVTLALAPFNGFVPSDGQSFTIIDRTGGSGTFNGLPEGAVLPDFLGQSGVNAVISYVGGTGDDVVITVDTTPPSLTITPDGTTTSDDPISFTFQFSEDVTGFTAGDVSLTNGTAGTFTQVDAATYTLDVSPVSDGLVTVSVAADVAQDLANNGNTAANASVTRADPLSITLTSSSVSEADGVAATTARVTRTGSTAAALTVTVSNPDRSELYLPLTVEIPIGAEFVEFPVATVNDGDIDGDQLGLSIGVSAGADSGSVLIDVTDDDSATTKTLGGHLFEPIAADSYDVLFDIDVDPGDTLVIAAGSTLSFNSGVALTVSGTLTADGDTGTEIVFTSSAATPAAGDWDGITVTAASQLRTVLDHVEIAYAVNGLEINSTATRPLVTLSQSDVHHSSADGVKVFASSTETITSSDVVITGNQIHDNTGDGVELTATSGTQFLIGGPSTSAFNGAAVNGNDIHGNGSAGIRMVARTSPIASSAFGVTGIVGPTITGNTIHDNDIGISGAATPGFTITFVPPFTIIYNYNTRDTPAIDAVIRNNLVEGNAADGIALITSSSSTPRRMAAAVTNNTIADNVGAGISHPDVTSAGFALRNNVLAGNDVGIEAGAAYTPAAAAVSSNLLFGNTSGGFANYPAAYGSISTTNGNGTPADAELNIFVDPRFIAPDNYRILYDSPAIDAGTTTGAPIDDLDGQNRSAIPDIGAFEVQSFTVDILADENDSSLGLGTGNSLREVFEAVNQTPGADIVSFAGGLGGEITLILGRLPELDSSVLLDGPGASQLDVSGNDASGVLSIGLGSDVKITGLTISDGNTTGHGGGIFNQGALDLADVVLSGNVASQNGGAIYSSGSGSLELTRVSIIDSVASFGAGILARANVDISDSTLSGNSASGNGGGILLQSGAVATVEGSTLHSNSGQFGGGVHVDNSAAITITNSTISGNTATNNGGGVLKQSNGTLKLVNATIAGNTADFGGGLFVNSGGNIGLVENSIVAGNAKLGAGFAEDVNGEIQANFSLVQSLVNTTFAAGSGDNVTGVDPLLSALADNGGLTLTRAFVAGQPCHRCRQQCSGGRRRQQSPVNGSTWQRVCPRGQFHGRSGCD